jgi:hypothetical protein
MGGVCSVMDERVDQARTLRSRPCVGIRETLSGGVCLERLANPLRASPSYVCTPVWPPVSASVSTAHTLSGSRVPRWVMCPQAS